MKLEFLVIALMLRLIYGDENATTTTSAPSTQSSSTSSPSTSTMKIPSTTQATTFPTSTIPNLTNSSKPVRFPSNRTRLLNTTSYACSCDLTLNCDINCCCDMDCSDGILQAFRCDDGVKIDDYYYGEGLERCEIDNGLFCIFRDSLGSPNYYAPIHPEYSTYRWPEKSSIDLEPRREDVHDFYKYGDEIITYNNKTKSHNTIKIPATLTDSTCYLSQPVTFLEVQTVKCLKSLNELCAYNKNLILQLVNSQLFRRPSNMLDTRDEAAGVFNINIQSCQHTLGNCSKISMNEDGVEELELLGEEVFDEIQMDFVINDTSITSLTVRFFSHEELPCGIEELAHTKVIQKIDVRFKNENAIVERLTRKYSRGYNDEELIIASRLRPVNESVVDGDKVLDYFRNDTDPEKDFHMKIPEVRKGRCVLNDVAYDSIRFNEHSKTVCAVELARDGKLNETCQLFQRQIVYFLFNTMNLTSNYTQDNFASDVYISQFWSPSNDLLSWKRVVVQNPPTWNPEQRETEHFVICSNIATFINYSFYSSRITKARKYENLIEKVVVKFGYTEELQIPIDAENRTTKADIIIQVQHFILP